MTDSQKTNVGGNWKMHTLGDGTYAGAVLSGMYIARAAASFTRPNDTTAYAANDVVSNSTSASTLLTLSGLGRYAGAGGYIFRLALLTDKKSITPRFRVHLYNASTPTVAADNVAMKSLYADAGLRLGTVDLDAMTTPADTTNSTLSLTQHNTIMLPYVCAAADTALYALLETLDAFTPAAQQAFTLTVFAALT